MNRWDGAIVGLIGALTLEKGWKHLMVRRFFWQAIPIARRPPRLVSLLQPILSGDPTLADCLEANLRAVSSYEREFVWLVDENDPEGQRIAREVAARHPEQRVKVLVFPPPPQQTNPKLFKLIRGAREAAGDVLCVLDDDTRLPDGGLEECLPFLEEAGVGLAFGLPYYLYFGGLWSSLVAAFVNSHSLLTYIPYTRLTDPFTINGMFYAIRRDVFDSVGGFDGLEGRLADDFAVAQRLRGAGYRLAQTPLRHGISTHVSHPGHYLSLIQRWFIFPRESLMRELRWDEQAILYGLGLGTALGPLWLALALLARWWQAGPPPRWVRLVALVPLLHHLAVFLHVNKTYLRRSTPARWFWLVPLIQALFPWQLLGALLAPQRIVWRGHRIQVERGGGFRFIRRRD